MTGLKICVSILITVTVFMAGLTITCVSVSEKKIKQKNRTIRQLNNQLNSKEHLITGIGHTQGELLADIAGAWQELEAVRRERNELRAENNRLRVRLDIYRKGQRKEEINEIQSMS